jgi:plastocyanin
VSDLQHTPIAVRIWAVALSAGLLAACGGGGNQSSSTFIRTDTGTPSSTTQTPLTSAPAVPAGSEIVISNFAYTVPASVSPGQQITIVNKDDANHTVTADQDDLFDVRVSGGGGVQTFTAPMTPGSYPFHCKYHADMHGTLVVK